jgi:amino acid adenylation domain-containing protein
MENEGKSGLTLSDRKLQLLTQLMAEEGLEDENAIARRSDPRELPLSSGQRRLWFLDRLEAGIHYNDHFNLRLTGRLDVAALTRSIEEILRRHEAMRVAFTEIDGTPRQSLAPIDTLRLARIDLSKLPEPDQAAAVEELGIEEARRSFNLSTGPLWRFTLLVLNAEDHLLLITAHHIAIDGWSRGVFLKELSVLYPAFLAGESSPLQDLPIQFADYAAWQSEWLRSETVERQLEYWKRQLHGSPTFLELPTDRFRPTMQTFRGARHWVTLPRETTAALNELCRAERATLFMGLLAVLQILLNRYTGQEDILIGTPVANRNRKELEGLIGYFLNMLVLRGKVSGDPTFRELLHAARQTTLDALAHQDVPLDQVIDILQREGTNTPRFQVLFVLQNAPMPTPSMAGINVQEWEVDSGTSRFDLTLSLTETPEGLKGRIEYATDLFDADRIERLDGHFRTLIEQVVAKPDARLSELSLLTARERHLALVEWNHTESDYSRSRCVHELFEEQARRTPERVAVEFDGERWTYRQLNARADRVAAELHSIGVTTDALVAICMDRSLEMVAAMLGVLKAGGAYLPLDPAYPKERLDFILEEARPVAVLEGEDPHPALRADLSRGERDRGASRAERSEGGPSPSGRGRPAGPGEGLAYVIYTSGSTDKPKGVQIEHRSVVNLLESIQWAPGINQDDVLVAVTTASFDIAVLELFLPLITGAKVVIADRETAADGRRLARLLERGATVMQATPATWRLLLAAGWKGNPKFKILCGGEAWDRGLTESLLARCGSLWNMYGSAATTVWSAATRIMPGQPVLISRPIANARFYIVDRFFQLLPVGVPGELCIGGDGVARGYLNRPDITAEKFLPDRFSGKPGARLYRTGDLARYRADGSIQLLGRMDIQTTLRGFHLELGEIESVLCEHPSVRQAAAIVREDNAGNQRLAAYLVQSAGRTLGPTQKSEIRTWVRTKLPEYMTPTDFVVMDALPLTPNGKINRKALPAPSAPVESPTAAAPRDALENQLVRIWEDILGVRPIGLSDNFFDLGGHSLTAVRLFSEVRKQTGRDLPLGTLFQAPTIGGLAEILRKDGWSPGWSSLVSIQPAGSRPTFFCVHGGGGNVLLFRELARHLGSDYPFYGLQSRGLDGKSKYLTTVHEMASVYLQEIRKLQPEGPYYLGGFCMGGLVAYEMAQQLRAQGQQTNLLALFETYNFNGMAPPLSLPNRLQSLKQKIYFHWANVMKLPLMERVAYLREKIKGVRVRETFRVSGILAGEASLERMNEKAGCAYLPSHYPGEIILFQPKEDYDFHSKPRLGWDGFAAALEVFEMPVYPGGLFVEPYVRLLAELLRECIDKAEQPQTEASNICSTT